MKHIYSILLILCCICASTACSENDTEKGPAKLPVTDIKIPATVKPGEALTIQGKGFTKESRVLLQSVKPLPMEQTAVNNSNLTISIPEDFETGVYFIFLQQTIHVWEIGRINVITNKTSPVSKIVVPTEAIAGNLITVEGEGFAANCKLTLVGLTDEQELEIVHRTDNSLNLRLPVMLKTNDYTLLLRQGEQWELGTIRINTKNTPARLAQIIHVKEDFGMKSSDTTTFMYRNNILESLILSDKSSKQKYTYTYEEGMITVDEYSFSTPYPALDDPGSSNEEGYWKQSGSFAYTLTDNRVSSHELWGTIYEWNYNQESYLTSLTHGDNSTVYNYQIGNLSSIAKDERGTKTDYTFIYTEGIANDRPGIDMMAPLLNLLNDNTAEYQAHLLNICGSISAFLPSEIKVKDKSTESTYNIAYRTINGYITKIIKTGLSSAKETYEISYE